MKTNEFSLGQCCATPRALAELGVLAINQLLYSHGHCRWGNTCAEDCELNARAVEAGCGRVISKWVFPAGDVFVLTEANRRQTTVLFASEY